MRRELLLVIAFVILIRLPFLNQAIQGDDIYYLAGAQHAQIDPAHPNHAKYVFEGDLVDMRGHPHPPLNAWFLGGLLAVFGDVYERPFHAAYLVFSLIAAVSMWMLASRFSTVPLHVTLLFLSTPAFVVNGTSLESDIPFVAFWMAGIALFIRAVDKRSIALLLASSVALALAAAAAYQAIVSVPILWLYLWMQRRDWKPAWAVACTAAVVVGAYQVYERLTSGAAPATVLAGYFSKYALQQLQKKLQNAAALTVHAGWIVFPVLAVLAFRRMWIAGVVAAAAGAFIDPHPLFWASFGIGAMVIAWCAARREFLTAWVVIFFASALVLFFAGSARYLLPMAAPVAILAASHKRYLVPAIICQLALSLALAWVNYEHWDGYRRFAESAGKVKWVNGEWGLRFYLESRGALPVLKGQALHPGETMARSELGYPVPVTSGGGQLVRVKEQEIAATLPLRLIGLNSRSGYSTADKGFRPFDISRYPIDRVRVESMVEKEPTLSYLPMNAREASEQIISGLFDLEQGQWRWMGAEGVIALKPPNVAAPLEVSLYIPDASPVRGVRMELDGKTVASGQYGGPGPQTLRTDGPVMGKILTIVPDRTFSAPGDNRKLSLIVVGAGFRK